MPSLKLSQVAGIFLALIAVYFPVALYLQYSFVPKPDPPKVTQLTGPFRKLDPTAYQAPMPTLDGFGDFESLPTRSTVTLFENGRPLGPAHSPKAVVNGGYSHHRGTGIIFSASDNSDPNTNGRTYSVTWR
ncbi:hypothetical protein QA645_16965 [Bradyrhizobium sp. CIAT3101]|uniref:hypothetical protein n=1 Tax=Bradyrhizobium sp. CIAT3101 TaxID=439387 RepID=UPI0024B1289C|nr:hypothetical protein [Bradyrhizobium sp. CIAT3101]WFU84365.1 hypothetical protein QA645_16965 [Bradyrhizobium sp. CIAT3101]